MKSQPKRWRRDAPTSLLGGLAFAMVLSAPFLAVNIGNAEADAERFGAILTFTAALTTAMISMLGLMLKRQSELRLSQKHADERERLRLDAAMRAAELFQAADGTPTDSAATASGLLALTELERSDLAVALLVDLWSEDKDRVSTETAVLVIDAALGASDSNAQLVAAELLCRNSHRLDACQSLHWPGCIDGQWVEGLNARAKLLIVDALVRMACTSDPNENALRSVAVRLYGIWDGDPSPRVRGCIATLLGALVTPLRRLQYSDFMMGTREPVTLNQFERAAKDASPNPDGSLERFVADRSRMLAEWSSSCGRDSPQAGSLGTGAYALDEPDSGSSDTRTRSRRRKHRREAAHVRPETENHPRAKEELGPQPPGKR